MTITIPTGGLISAVIALIAGLAIFAFPRLLNYIVAAYLVIIGLVGVLAYFGAR
jgi:hypothetical protein